MEKLKTSSANVDALIEKAKRDKTIDKLTPEIVRLFIARIEIGERTVKYSRHSAQKIPYILSENVPMNTNRIICCAYFRYTKGIGKNGQDGQTSAREAYLHTSRADFVRSKKENFTEKLIF